MELEVVLDWIEGLENHFECDGIIEAQKVKFSKAKGLGCELLY